LLAVRLRAFIVNLLKKASPTSTLSIPRNVVYDHPSIAALADYALSFIRSPVKPEASSEQGDIKTRVSRVVERYTEGLAARRILNGIAGREEKSECVVVTGATGSLGAFLVDQLLDRPTVKKIYCFNRKLEMDTRQRQINAFRERGLETKKLEAALEDRVFVYDVDLSQPRLGLSDLDYKEVLLDYLIVATLVLTSLQISTHVTHIIHVAWQLNFHLRMEGFEKVHIAGVRHLIDLALASSRKRSPHFVFVSSIATIARQRSGGAANTLEGPILEESSASLGYGLAKLAGERICETACEKAKLDTTIVRIGQIS
jgi:nucleoside-diphosphate-sugar epimerase